MKLLAKGLLLTTLLSACGHFTPPRSSQPVTTDYVVAVPAGQSGALERQYGATVLGAPLEDGTVLMGLSQAGAEAYNAQMRGQSGGARAEKNRGAFQGGGITATMGGTRSIWATGDIRAWNGGTRSIWATGQYNVVPANTNTFKRIRLDEAHTIAPRLGAGVEVAVIDTGLDLSHPAFVGALAPAQEWKDFIDGDALPQDEGILGVGGFGHGTAVAGLILQMAPNATILPIRVLGKDGSGDTANVALAIDHAVAMGAKIINLSLGSDQRATVVQDAIKRATDRNVLVVASAGNDNAPTITYPAADASLKGSGVYALSVGSVDAADRKSSFSNYSNSLEVVAPGEQLFTPAPGGLLVAWSGTSMSAPLVSGALALALGQTLSVDSKDLTKKLAENAFDVYKGGLNDAYKDKLGIKGRLDVRQFLNNSIRY